MTLRLNGSTSGYVELDAPAVAGTSALTLPASSGTVATTAYADTAGGLQLITTQTFSAVSSVSVNNCFTGTYDNYRIVLRGTSSTATALLFRLRLSGTDNATGSSYSTQILDVQLTTIAGDRNTTSDGRIGAIASTLQTLCIADFAMPAVAVATGFISQSNFPNGNSAIHHTAGTHNQTVAYDGISIFPSAGTFSGTVRIYGYKNS